jgi:hypothetical protein
MFRAVLGFIQRRLDDTVLATIEIFSKDGGTFLIYFKTTFILKQNYFQMR